MREGRHARPLEGPGAQEVRAGEGLRGPGRGHTLPPQVHLRPRPGGRGRGRGGGRHREGGEEVHHGQGHPGQGDKAGRGLLPPSQDHVRGHRDLGGRQEAIHDRDRLLRQGAHNDGEHNGLRDPHDPQVRGGREEVRPRHHHWLQHRRLRPPLPQGPCLRPADRLRHREGRIQAAEDHGDVLEAPREGGHRRLVGREGGDQAQEGDPGLRRRAAPGREEDRARQEPDGQALGGGQGEGHQVQPEGRRAGPEDTPEAGIHKEDHGPGGGG